jgi:hypothetical protein
MLTRRISLVLVRNAGVSNNSDNAACCHVARHTKWSARAFMGRAKPPLSDTWSRPLSPKDDERARDIPASMRVFKRRWFPQKPSVSTGQNARSRNNERSLSFLIFDENIKIEISHGN